MPLFGTWKTKIIDCYHTCPGVGEPVTARDCTAVKDESSEADKVLTGCWPLKWQSGDKIRR